VRPFRPPKSLSLLALTVFFDPEFAMSAPPMTWNAYAAFLESLHTPPEIFWRAAHTGDLRQVKHLLTSTPQTEVNWRHPRFRLSTPLLEACLGGHEHIVLLLLSHPEIDVNLGTPFVEAAARNKISCLLLLLRDFRMVPTMPNQLGYTAIRNVARAGHVDVLMWWIASGRDLGDLEKVILEARGGTVRSLLEQYSENSINTRNAVMAKLKIAGGCIFFSSILGSGRGPNLFFRQMFRSRLPPN